jgi:hypothetical protein
MAHILLKAEVFPYTLSVYLVIIVKIWIKMPHMVVFLKRG